jgi:hypothetical protein
MLYREIIAVCSQIHTKHINALCGQNVELLSVKAASGPIPVAVQSEAWFCGRSLAGIVVSNPAGSMDVCLLLVLCVVRYRSLRRADFSSRGILPTVVSLSVIVKPRYEQALAHCCFRE